jgi:hypothetical protein
LGVLFVRAFSSLNQGMMCGAQLARSYARIDSSGCERKPSSPTNRILYRVLFSIPFILIGGLISFGNSGSVVGKQNWKGALSFLP